jgi:hypothetical protein
MDRLRDWLDLNATALGFWAIIAGAVAFSLAPVFV